MATSPPQPKVGDRAVLRLNASLQILNSAKDACRIPTAQVAFDSVIDFLTAVRDTMANEHKYVHLGATCVIVCTALERGLNGRGPDDLSMPVFVAIEELIRTVTEMQTKIVKQRQRNAVSRLYHAVSGRDKFSVWKHELQMILHAFNTQLSVNNHLMLSDIRRDVQAVQGGSSPQTQSTQTQVVAVETQSVTSASIKGFGEFIEEHKDEIEEFFEEHKDEIQEGLRGFCADMAEFFQEATVELDKPRICAAD